MYEQDNDTPVEKELQAAELKEIKKNYYVDKHALHAALVVYRAQCAIAKEVGNQVPQVPDFIGDCFLKIAKHLSYHPWFVRYSYRDDMIMDGVEACIRYVKSFDPEKSKEAFSYFTRTCWRAFRHRCDVEYSESLLKGEMIAELSLDTMFMDETEGGVDSESCADIRQFVVEHSSYGKRPTKKKRLRPKKDYSSPIDDFYEEVVDTSI